MMHSTKFLQMIPLHWLVILRWATQGPLARFLSFTSHINCIVARCLINVVYLTACAFLNYVIIASLKSETMGKLIKL